MFLPNEDYKWSKKQVRRNKSRLNRLRRLYEKQNGLCWICCEEMELRADDCLKMPKPNQATLDHIVPRSLGGTSTIVNLRAAHSLCNSRRGSDMKKLPDDFWLNP